MGNGNIGKTCEESVREGMAGSAAEKADGVCCEYVCKNKNIELINDE